MLHLNVGDLYFIVIPLLTTHNPLELVFRYWRIGEETTNDKTTLAAPRTASKGLSVLQPTGKYILQPYIPFQSANNTH